MDFPDLKSIDLKDLARASAPVKAVLLGVLFLVIIGLGYYLDWSGGMEDLDKLRNEEKGLRETFTQKKRQAIHYEAYKQRLKDIEQSLAALLKQLPNKAEMDALLTDINQAGVGRGLEFDLFRPGSEGKADFYATLPVTIKVKGNYHDVAGFVSDIAQLPRIVTVHDISLAPIKEGDLAMDATLRTYRYLEEDEGGPRKDDNKGGKKDAKKGGKR